MDVDPGLKDVEKIRGGNQWYMMESEDFISNFIFRLKNENGNLVSFNCQNITFRLSIKGIRKSTTFLLSIDKDIDKILLRQLMRPSWNFKLI